MKNGIYYIFITIAFLVVSCGSTKYYYAETNKPSDNNQVYTELQLKKNRNFEEYIYWELNDSLDNDNYGILIRGTYTISGDSLFLTYNKKENTSPATNQFTYDEAFIIEKEELKQIAPISYSYSYLDKVLRKGKSIKLRNLPVFSTIIWKPI